MELQKLKKEVTFYLDDDTEIEGMISEVGTDFVEIGEEKDEEKEDVYIIPLVNLSHISF